MSEEFIINNIKLKVNPDDISVIQHRNLKTAQFIRDDATYTSKSIFPRTSYNISLSFDLSDSTEVERLVTLATQVDMYPFAFIESDRLSTYIGNSYKATNGFQIFGIQEYSFTQTTNREGVVIVNLNLIHFNYIPFCAGFGFYDVSERKKRSKTLTGGAKEEIEYVPVSVSTPFQSKMFASYFGPEIRERLSKVNEYGSSEKPNSFFAIRYPDILAEKPPEDSDFEEIIVTSPGGITNIAEGSKETPSDKMSIWVRWNSLVNDNNKVNLNETNRVVEVISVSKSNNFAVHRLTGWSLPVLQYMGKGPSRYQVNFCLDSTGSYQKDSDTTSPVTFMKYATSKIDVNYMQNRAYDAYNVLKVDCLLTSILPSFGFAVDSESIQASAYDQGKDVYAYSLKESDVRKLMDRSKYTNAGTKEVDIQASIMIRVIKSITDEFIKTKWYKSLTAQEKADTFLAVTTFGITAVGDFIYDSEAEQLYNVLLDLNQQLVRKEKEMAKTEFDSRFPTVQTRRGARTTRDRSSRIDAFQRSMSQIDPLDFRNSTRLLDERLNPTGRFRGDDLLKIDRSLEQVFYKILRMADAGNKFCSQAVKYVDLIQNNYNNIVEDFNGEAIDDLYIGNRLGVNAGALKEYGFEDPRDIPPFFFIRQERYMNASLMKDQIDTIDFTIEDIGKAIQKTASNGGEEVGLSLKNVTPDLNNSDMSKSKLSASMFMSGRVEIDEQEGNTFKDVFKSETEEEVDPFGDKDLNLFHSKRMAYSYEHGLNLAFPAMKVFLVDGDETELKNSLSLRKHTYYEIKGISELRVGTNSDDNPVDVLQMSIANPGSVYTDDHVAFNADKDNKNPELSNTTGENRFPVNEIRIRPGNRLHVKAGYGNNPNELETIFNGVITQVGGEATLTVEAEGFGRELIAYEHGDDPSDDNFFMSADTDSIIASALYSSEIEHFGTMKWHLPFQAGPDPEARSLGSISPFGLFAYSAKTRLFSNIFSESLKLDTFKSNITGVFDIFGGRQAAYDFPIYRSTPWNMLKQMEYRHPGTLSKPVLYGDRHSYFFGIKEQLYIYRDLANGIMAESSTLRNIFGPQNKNTLYKKLRSKRFKPVCDFHIFSSDHNIIENNLRVTDNFNTVLNVQYYGDQSKIEDGDFDYYEMKIDDNLKPSAHRRGEFSMLGIHGKYMAYKYGSVGLRREAEKMYDGTICVIGNPNIKAGDYAGLYDEYRSLRGIVKIRECVHEFSLNGGYVTKITPGLYCESAHFDYSKLFSTLFIAAGRAVDEIKVRTEVSFQSDPTYLRSMLMLNISNDILGKEFGPGTVDTNYQNTVGAALSTATTAGLTAVTMSTAYSLLSKSDKMRKFLTNGVFKAADLALRGGAAAASLTTKATGALTATFGTSRVALLGVTAINTATTAARLGIGLARMAGPIGWAIGLVIGLFTAKLEEIESTRQPVRIYPLQLKGMPYLGGINGFKENSYFESVGEEIKGTAENIAVISRFMTSSNDRI